MVDTESSVAAAPDSGLGAQTPMGVSEGGCGHHPQ